MAASQATLELRNNTDANFRLWGEFISDGLAAGGWTLEDTDIDWSTVTAPAQNTYAGYEIWKSPDEVGLTNFYLKLRYGSNNNAATAAAVEYQVGWGYPGSGSSLSGVVMTAQTNQASGNAGGSTIVTCRVVANPGSLVINMGNAEISAGALFLIVSRLRNSDIVKDDIVGAYSHAVVSGTSHGLRSQVITPTEAGSVTSVVTGTVSDSTTIQEQIFDGPLTFGNGGVSRGRVGLGTLKLYRAARQAPPEEYIACPTNALGSAGDQVSVSVYGTTRNYIIMPANNSPGGWRFSTNHQSLHLYE